MALHLQETFINETKNCQFGKTEIYEASTDSIGRLYRDLSKEYGRCSGKVYLDTKSRGTIATGWVFQKRMRYEDARGKAPNDFYIRTVWVSLFEPCELTDPLALRRKTRLGEEVIGFTHKALAA